MVVCLNVELCMYGNLLSSCMGLIYKNKNIQRIPINQTGFHENVTTVFCFTYVVLVSSETTAVPKVTLAHLRLALFPKRSVELIVVILH